MTKILLVEDDKSLREIYGVRLLAEGYDIVSAGDGEEALAMAIKERPQLIVSDVMMPKISGFDMLDILRSTSETKDIKVIMMTALSSEDQRARGEALGADRYLVKSQVGIEDVVRTVHDVLADAPVSAASAQATFGTPGPSAVIRPAAPVAPRPVTVPQQTTPNLAPSPAPTAPPVQTYQAPAPVAVTPQPVTSPPVTAPPAAPVAPPVSPQPTYQPPVTQQPAPTQLPQPSAPFSSPRPASLGDRVINPITPQGTTPDVASLMNQELAAASQPPVLTQPPVPPTPPYPPTPSQTV